jgi:hypothetical protein
LSRLRRRHGLPDERSYTDERRRDQGCGDQEKGKEAMAAGPRCGRRRLGEAARQTVRLLKIIFPWHWIPMRRRVLDRLSVFTDPSTGLRRPVSDIIGPKRPILDEDDVFIPRCGLNRMGQWKPPLFCRVIAPFLFANTGSVFPPVAGLKLLLVREACSALSPMT